MNKSSRDSCQYALTGRATTFIIRTTGNVLLTYAQVNIITTLHYTLYTSEQSDDNKIDTQHVQGWKKLDFGKQFLDFF